jgi:hypothetical protein
MRSLLALAAVVVLAGCGSGTVERAGAPIVPDRPSPPIVPVDEAPPDDVTWFLQHDFEPPSTTSTGVGVITAELVCTDRSGDRGVCPEPTPEERAQAQQAEEDYLKSIRPAAGSPPRVIAKLALAGGGHELFTAWHDVDGKLCWETDDVRPDGGGGGGPSGPCTASSKCDAFCLDSSGVATTTYELSGTVPTAAAALRVTTADGQVSTYELDGPVVDGDRRVFMLELGPSDWRRLELVRHGAVFDTQTMPETTVAFEECDAEVGSMPQPTSGWTPHTPELDAYSKKLDACLKAKDGWPPSTIGVDTAATP